jgi:putative oxidoreductase
VITLMCSEAGWPKPKYAAWLVALTEFVGGALLLVGFLSRVWGLGLAITMGCAFYLVAIGQLSVHASNPFLFAENIGSYQTVVTQLGLFVLAFGILLTGAGPVSLDRLLFGARGKKHLETGLAEEGVLGQGSSGGGRPV